MNKKQQQIQKTHFEDAFKTQIKFKRFGTMYMRSNMIGNCVAQKNNNGKFLTWRACLKFNMTI